MKQASDALAKAIKDIERSFKRKAKGITETPQEKGFEAVKLSEARSKKRRSEAQQIAQQARLLPLDPDTLAKIDAAAKKHAEQAETWGFTMISTVQQAAVMDWLEANSKRPLKALRLWGHLLANMDRYTGEILASRVELAERVGIPPRDLSSIITELASINAVRREKQGREVRYHVNSNIATHLPSAALRAQARENDGPLLKIMEGEAS